MMIAVNFIFTLVPNVPWQGVPIAELSRTRIAVPDILSSKVPILNSKTSLMPLLEAYNTSSSEFSRAENNLRREIETLRSEQSAVTDPAGENVADIDAIMAPLVSQFEEQLHGPRTKSSGPAAVCSTAFKCDCTDGDRCANRFQR